MLIANFELPQHQLVLKCRVSTQTTPTNKQWISF